MSALDNNFYDSFLLEVTEPGADTISFYINFDPSTHDLKQVAFGSGTLGYYLL